MSKRGKYGAWEEGMMERAIISYRNGDQGLNAAAKTYNVPKATLKRRLDGTNVNAIHHIQAFGRTLDLPKALEDELAKHVLLLEERFFGLTRNDLRRLAYQIAEANNIPHRFNKDKKMAGDKWYYGFMSRHPEISLRQPEATSIARAQGFNRERVASFFKVLAAVVDSNHFDATTIFNMDETGLSTVQKPQEVLGIKGKHQIGGITSGERGTNTTCVCCMSALGMYIPPMLIFKRLRFKQELSEGAPPGTKFACTESGWITSKVFVEWLKFFIDYVQPKNDRKVLLIMDGHSTHTKNLEAIELARKSGVIMVSIPAHTTHRLQPLDVGFFKPLSTYFNQECDKSMRTHPGMTITQFQISQLFCKAYGRSSSIEVAMNSFKKCGIWPVDPDVFNVSDFAASEEVSSMQHPTEDAEDPQRDNEQSVPESNLTPGHSPKTGHFTYVKDISPLPKGDRKRRIASTSAAVLTSSRYKETLQQKQNVQKLKKVKKLNVVSEEEEKKKKKQHGTANSAIQVEPEI
ncbi:uncharacterized protein [Periplaneta americana]|uniref:uncharacterized protein n=1 Tax=Periplaneta americana TaxID=6978 RepID=UPI0037E8546A